MIGDRAAQALGDRRTIWSRRACSAWVPCEKFRRTTSTPAASSASSDSSVSVAGPMVATILARR